MKTIIPGLPATLLVLWSLSVRANELVLTAMVPYDVGWTVQKSPVLYFFISQATSLPIRFSLLDKRRIAPVADVPLSSPTGPGLVAIRLKDYNIVLEEDMQYRWYVSVVQNPDSHSKDIVAGGIIERVDPRLVDYYVAHVIKTRFVCL